MRAREEEVQRAPEPAREARQSLRQERARVPAAEEVEAEPLRLEPAREARRSLKQELALAPVAAEEARPQVQA